LIGISIYGDSKTLVRMRNHRRIYRYEFVYPLQISFLTMNAIIGKQDCLYMNKKMGIIFNVKELAKWKYGIHHQYENPIDRT